MGLFSAVFGGIGDALSDLTEQFSVVQDLAIAPVKAIVQQVVDGMWVGDGADAFVQELSSLAIPGIGQVGENITTFSTCITKSRDIVQQADEATSGLVKSTVGEVFDFF